MHFKKVALITLVSMIAISCVIITFVSLDTFKVKLSEQLKETYGVTLTFARPIEHSLWAPTTLSMKGVLATHAEKELLSIGEIAVDFDLSRFVFGGDIVFKTILLRDSRIDLSDETLKLFSANGETTAEDSESKESSGGIFAIDSLTVHNTSLKYNKIDLQEIEIKGRINDKRIVAEELLLKGYDGDVNLKGEIDLATLYFNVSGHLKNIELGKVLPLFGDDAAVATGKASAILDLHKEAQEWSSLAGNVEVHGKELTVTGIDLDQLLDGFIDSREVGLLDVTSFFALGPVGLLLTNTLEGGKSFSIWGKGETQVEEIMVSLTANEAVAHIKDVALSTEDKRVALVGAVDLSSYAFQEFSFHILDREGCSRIFQKISGTLTEPDIGITKTFVDGVISPVTDVLKRTRDLFSCTPVYSGVVAHPKRSFFGW